MPYSHPTAIEEARLSVMFRRGADEEGDFGEIVSGASSGNLAHKDTITALADKFFESLSVLDTKAMPSSAAANECVVSEVIAQWEALSRREDDPVYKISSSTTTDPVERNRNEICGCFYGLIDKLNIEENMDRRIVGIALSYLSRYLARRHPPSGEYGYKLALTTSLYLAIKIHCCRTKRSGDIPIDYVAKQLMNRNQFTIRQISRMEASILDTLEFCLHDPVPQQFIDVLTPLIETFCDENGIASRMKQQILFQSIWLCEVSVADSFFTGVKSSSVAYAAILLAMEIASNVCAISRVKRWLESLDLKHDAYLAVQCYDRLLELCCLFDESHYGKRFRCLSPTDVTTPLNL